MSKQEPPGFSIDEDGIAHRGPAPLPAPVPPPVPQAFRRFVNDDCLSCYDCCVAEEVWTWLREHGYLREPGQADDGWVPEMRRMHDYLQVQCDIAREEGVGNPDPVLEHVCAHVARLMSRPTDPPKGDADDAT